MTEALVSPYEGTLVDLVVDSKRAREIREQSRDWPSWTLTPRQLCDLELLANGAFSPLRGFMSRRDYESVCRSLRLASGVIWPIPITLDVPESLAPQLSPGRSLALRNGEGRLLAVLHVDECWLPDKSADAAHVYGTTSRMSPAVVALNATHPWYVGGRIEALEIPSHADFKALRRTPRELRDEFAEAGWTRVVAFQARNPMHRAHVELTQRAIAQAGAKLLIHSVVGSMESDDVDSFARVRCHEAIVKTYAADSARLALLPLAMRMGGPREALLHAIVERNFGCSHLIVGCDDAGPGCDENNVPFHGSCDAQELLHAHEREIGVQVVPSREMVYVIERQAYMPEDEVPEGATIASISETKLRAMLANGEEIPPWFSDPEVVRELRRTHPPRQRQGFTVFFTGLSGAGKSTIAQVLLVKLLERGDRQVRLLDGDLVRQHLSSELGFSKEHRDLNIRRIGFVASEITRCGGAVLCAAIAPYDEARKAVRAMIEPLGGYVLVHVATPLAVCEQRDPKGLYAKARAGTVVHFTGISDPYEEPSDAEIVIHAEDVDPEDAADRIYAFLTGRGFLNAVETPVSELTKVHPAG